jgi:hypothetical protein
LKVGGSTTAGDENVFDVSINVVTYTVSGVLRR